MNIWILDKGPKEIKNPFEPDDPHLSNMFWAGAEEYKQAVLAHAHEIDIDEAVKEWEERDSDWVEFSRFLQEKITEVKK